MSEIAIKLDFQINRISIMNAVAKIYDYILCNRLMRWFVPDQEQAGAIPGRSCIDHIVTLRLLINFAMHKRREIVYCIC
jgi:hypothetical protein